MTGQRSPGATILLAEDDVLVRLVLADFLRACGYAVIEAASAQEARRVLVKGPPVRILLADAALEDGFALAQWARRARPAMAIALSGSLTKKTAAAVALCEAPYEPPCSAKTLMRRIQTLKGRAARSEGLRTRPPKILFGGVAEAPPRPLLGAPGARPG